jgi:WD40 repeat protein
MSKVIFTNKLVDRIGLLGDVMASFLEEQVDAIQKRLVDNYSNADDDTAWKVISTFSTLEGTKIPMMKSEVQAQLEYPENQLDLVLGLFEKARILRLADGIYEIAHDTLALQISEKRSGEEKGLLEVKKLLTDRYTAYVQTGALMGRKEIDYINPYASRLEMSEEQADFFEKSKKFIKRRRAALIGGLVTAFLVISLFAVYALIQQQAAIENAEVARSATKQAEAEKVKALEAKAEAEDATKQAEAEKEKADLAKQQAEAEKGKAIIAKTEAEQQKAKADVAKEQAEKERAKAEKQKKEADLAKQQAEKEKGKALEAKAEADSQKEIALEAKKDAEIQKERALKNEKVAKELRVKSLSTALAIKSSSIKYNDRLKNLLAMKAYSLHETIDGGLVDAEVYNGLYSAVANASGEGFDEIEKAHTGAIRSIISTGKDDMYTTGSDGTLRKWHFSSWKETGKPSYNVSNIGTKTANAVDIKMNASNDGKWLAIGGKKSKVELYNIKEKSFEKIDLHDGKGVYDLVFSPDSKKIFSVGEDKNVKTYNIETKISKIILPLMFQTEAVAISSDGQWLAVGSKTGFLQIYKVGNYTAPISVRFTSGITALSFDKNTESLAVGLENGEINLFKKENGIYSKKGKDRKKHGQRISAIKFEKHIDDNNNASDIMAVGSYDGTVSLWMISKFGDELYEPLLFEDNQKWVMSLEFVNNGNQLAVGHLDGKMKFWTLEPQKVADRLCEIIKNKHKNDSELNDLEFKQYLGTGIKKADIQPYCK